LDHPSHAIVSFFDLVVGEIDIAKLHLEFGAGMQTASVEPLESDLQAWFPLDPAVIAHADVELGSWGSTASDLLHPVDVTSGRRLALKLPFDFDDFHYFVF